MKFSSAITRRLENRKNLLTFSGGADSTALFYLLREQKIHCDIAIVNYRTRPQSDDECAYAQELAKSYGLSCHIHHAEPITENFEHNARTIRYGFFESLIHDFGYENLITAHQLGDRLEWLLMQLCKGSGLLEMAGMQPIEQNGDYAIVRPLLSHSKDELISYLKEHGYRWYEDESNSNEQYRRNYFRNRFATPMIEEYKTGIAKSFAYLDEDRDTLLDETQVHQLQDLCYFTTRPQRRATLRMVDTILKRAGFLMRQGDREALKSEDCIVAGRRYVIAISEKITIICPYEEAVMDKAFKEQCRQLQIAPKLRGYLYRHPETFEALTQQLS